jgi:hypothetical protein
MPAMNATQSVAHPGIDRPGQLLEPVRRADRRRPGYTMLDIGKK